MQYFVKVTSEQREDGKYYLQGKEDDLMVTVHGTFDPEAKTIEVGVASGDDSFTDAFSCDSLRKAESIMARETGDWAKIAGANL